MSRLGVRPAWLALAVSILAGTHVSAQTSADAWASFRTGDYAAAISAFRGAARSGSVEATVGLVRALAMVGRYDDAEDAARSGVERHGVDLQGALGRVLYARGQVGAAETAFRAAAEGGAADALTALADLGTLQLRRGQRDEAMRLFDGFIDVYNQGRATTSADLEAVGTAVRYLGTDAPDLFQDALRAFDEAIAADPNNQDAQIQVGKLFLDKYNGPDADASFAAVLTVNPNHPDALVGMARTLRFDGRSGAREALDQALEVNPNHVDARVTLAGLHLSAERHPEAREEAERALEVNPASLEALAVLAASYYLAEEPAEYERVRDQALALNPRAAELFNTVADLAVDHRRYAQAVELAELAVDLDPSSWRGHGIRGINLLRLGRVEESREALETAFAGDPFNVWFKNTLDLLDTYERYRTVETEHFELFLREDEADLLLPYAATLAEEAWDSLVARYQYEPPTPVRLELYPSHADFSVRTAGLAGIGILGVSFGSVLAMDSPSARDVGTFNWGSTLWHELAHAFHLGMTDHRVPRWFSEGLSVHEQRKARPGWGHQPDVGFLLAWDEDRMHPVSRMNEGFIRPSFPQQVVYSYYQASLVFDMVETEFGFQAVLDMLAGYQAGRSTEELIPAVFDLEPEALDRRFDDYMDDRFAATIRAVRQRSGPGSRPTIAALEAMVAADPDDFNAQFALGRMLAAGDDWEAALPHFIAARELFPEFGALDGPSWFLARAYEELGDVERAADAYRDAALRNESHYLAGVEEARIREEMGDVGGAAAALDRAIWVHPYEIEVHQQLAELMTRNERWQEAVRERKAVVALEPTDRAEAHYQLALAHMNAGQAAEARTQVLRALEVAPNYEDALELLLEIRAASSGATPSAQVQTGAGERSGPDRRGGQ